MELPCGDLGENWSKFVLRHGRSEENERVDLSNADEVKFIGLGSKLKAEEEVKIRSFKFLACMAGWQSCRCQSTLWLEEF